MEIESSGHIWAGNLNISVALEGNKEVDGEPLRERGKRKKFYFCSRSPQIPRLPLTYVNRKLWSRVAEGSE